jgi:hypothetical protein
MANTGTEPVRLPAGDGPGTRIVLQSAAVDGGTLPPDTTVWLV